MELSVNYSEEVKELFEEGKIDFIDYFKLFSINGDLSPFDWCKERRKVIFHGLVGDGSNVARKDFLENRDFELQDKYFKESRVPHISFHIALGKTDEFEPHNCVIETIKKNIEEIRKIFKYDILLENTPLSKGKPEYHFLAKPEFINEVIEKTNTYFLLDIAHARATAYTLDIPYMDYINALPLNKVREIHLSGCVKDENGVVFANHSKMNEEDYEVLDFLMKECKMLNLLTLEFGPYDIRNEITIPVYGKVDRKLKEEVFENLLRLKNILKK